MQTLSILVFFLVLYYSYTIQVLSLFCFNFKGGWRRPRSGPPLPPSPPTKAVGRIQIKIQYLVSIECHSTFNPTLVGIREIYTLGFNFALVGGEGGGAPLRLKVKITFDNDFVSIFGAMVYIPEIG